MKLLPLIPFLFIIYSSYAMSTKNNCPDNFEEQNRSFKERGDQSKEILLNTNTIIKYIEDLFDPEQSKAMIQKNLLNTARLESSEFINVFEYIKDMVGIEQAKELLLEDFDSFTKLTHNELLLKNQELGSESIKEILNNHQLDELY